MSIFFKLQHLKLFQSMSNKKKNLNSDLRRSQFRSNQQLPDSQRSDRAVIGKLAQRVHSNHLTTALHRQRVRVYISASMFPKKKEEIINHLQRRIKRANHIN